MSGEYAAVRAGSPKVLLSATFTKHGAVHAGAVCVRMHVRSELEGNTARRIIAKAIMMTLRDDILDMTGTLQLCAGQTAGCEAAIHAVRHMFNDNECEAVLLVDATNAFV